MGVQVYSDEYIRQLIDRVRGGESLRSVVAGEKIERKTFYLRLNAQPELRREWEKALADCGDAWAEKADEIVHQVLTDKGMDPKRAALAIDHYRWRAEKANPQRYGQRQTLEHLGDQGNYLEVLQRAQGLIEKARAELRQSAITVEAQKVDDPAKVLRLENKGKVA